MKSADEQIKASILKCKETFNTPELHEKYGFSKQLISRAIQALARAGRVEHVGFINRPKGCGIGARIKTWRTLDKSEIGKERKARNETTISKARLLVNQLDRPFTVDDFVEGLGVYKKAARTCIQSLINNREIVLIPSDGKDMYYEKVGDAVCIYTNFIYKCNVNRHKEVNYRASKCEMKTYVVDWL